MEQQVADRFLNANRPAWFALQVRHRYEKKVASVLEGKGYQHFVPTRTVASPRTRCNSDVPLFPGYVFCRFDSQLPGKVVTTPGVVRILGYGNAPSAVSDAEIEAIRAIAQSGLPVDAHPYLQEGDHVRICDGPLSGLTGKIVSVHSRNLLVVSVTLLQRSIAVELSGCSVIPLDQPDN